MKKFNPKHNSGFVILFSVTISSILLSIALGVASVALGEIRFGTSARDTNNAFFSADTGIECALFHDKESTSENAFTGTASINCAGAPIVLSGSSPSWNFVVVGLGSQGQSCAKITVNKDFSSPPNVFTNFVSKGYNIGDALCESTSTNRIEREIELNY